MPAKFRKLIAVLAAWGVTVEKPKSGSHWKARYGGKMYPIPAHGMGTEVPDHYIRGVCRAFDYDEFKRSL